MGKPQSKTSASVERTSTPKDLALRMRGAKSMGVLRRSLPLDQPELNLFSHGLVDRPRAGIWRITSKGRQLLADIQWRSSQEGERNRQKIDKN
jgi:hypothetical protein